MDLEIRMTFAILTMVLFVSRAYTQPRNDLIVRLSIFGGFGTVGGFVPLALRNTPETWALIVSTVLVALAVIMSIVLFFTAFGVSKRHMPHAVTSGVGLVLFNTSALLNVLLNTWIPLDSMPVTELISGVLTVLGTAATIGALLSFRTHTKDRSGAFSS